MHFTCWYLIFESASSSFSTLNLQTARSCRSDVMDRFSWFQRRLASFMQKESLEADGAASAASRNTATSRNHFHELCIARFEPQSVQIRNQARTGHHQVASFTYIAFRLTCMPLKARDCRTHELRAGSLTSHFSSCALCNVIVAEHATMLLTFCTNCHVQYALLFHEHYGWCL